MTEGPNKSRAWRDRAEEYRRFSEEAQTTQGQGAYLEVSRNCDQIAERLEKFEAAETESQRIRAARRSSAANDR